jgi:hypothetical protein
MAEAPKDPTAQVRAELEAAHSDLNAAAKKAIGDDGRIFMAAAAALELAIESLTPPSTESALAAQSCREALALLKVSRAHGQGGSSNAGMLLEKINERLTRIAALV